LERNWNKNRSARVKKLGIEKAHSIAIQNTSSRGGKKKKNKKAKAYQASRYVLLQRGFGDLAVGE